MADTQPHKHEKDTSDHAVRFSSVTNEISPATPADSLHQVTTSTENAGSEHLSEEQRKDLLDRQVSAQQSRLQSARMDQFVFEPVSLPPSRVPSGSSSYHGNTGNNPALSQHSSPVSRGNSQQILTPADSGNRDDSSSKAPPTPLPVTPQESPHPDGRTKQESKYTEAKDSAKAVPNTATTLVHPKPTPLTLPKSHSENPSQDNSPLGTPRETPSSGQHSPYSRPFTPIGDPNDPYSRSKRPPQNRNLESIDARFMFNKERPRSSIFPSGSESYKGSSEQVQKRASFFGGRKDSDESIKTKEKEQPKKEKEQPRKQIQHGHHHSMSDLKRFFKLGGSKKEKREKSPAPAPKAHKHRPGHITPRSASNAALPFADDHGLEAKYGKFEKILGSGAGGSVRLMKRQDGVTFAVKQFRERHAWETEKAYNKKITAEFCVGSTMHHGNIIEAMDIINEKGRWYEVMEYAPYDLFAIVMTGKMSREEVACCMMQILSGVAYLHSMGLAHRDLKLDNVVVNEYGIMKIIDFGSAHVFHYPFEGNNIKAEGVVGSDPYLAPEVFTQKQYDAPQVDIWSLAIIFCCMSLRRFPWKCPKESDNSYKLFTSTPTEDELRHPLYPQPRNSVSEAPPRPQAPPNESSSAQNESTHHHHHHQEAQDTSSSHAAPSTAPTVASSATSTSTQQAPAPQITLKGPWRLLRLLPRETRHIVGRMLEVDPHKRATLEEIIADGWVERTPFCRQEEDGRVVRAEGHGHTLEGGGGG